MDERTIRRQTEALLDAFHELTGTEAIPDIEQFLMLRTEAIAETQQGMSSSTNTKSIRPITEKETPKAQKKESVNPLPASSAEEKHEPPESFNKTPDEKGKKSAFDILRNIQDPWNA